MKKTTAQILSKWADTAKELNKVNNELLNHIERNYLDNEVDNTDFFKKNSDVFELMDDINACGFKIRDLMFETEKNWRNIKNAAGQTDI